MWLNIGIGFVCFCVGYYLGGQRLRELRKELHDKLGYGYLV
jgi:hypothetical protein